MYTFGDIGSVLCKEVVPFSEGPLLEVSHVFVYDSYYSVASESRRIPATKSFLFNSSHHSHKQLKQFRYAVLCLLSAIAGNIRLDENNNGNIEITEAVERYMYMYIKCRFMYIIIIIITCLYSLGLYNSVWNI